MVNENTDAEIYGVESELVFAPDEHWLLNANIAYLHSEATDFTSVDSRDPTDGRSDVTLIKDLSNASNCVVMIDPETFAAIAGSQFSSCTALADAGLPVTSTELTQIPSTTVQVENKDALNLMKLITHMDDLDDVAQVSANFEIDDEMMAKIEDQL